MYTHTCKTVFALWQLLFFLFCTLLFIDNHQSHYLRMSFISFFYLRFSAGLPASLCDYSLDIEFWVTINRQILVLFNDAESSHTRLSVTHRSTWLSVTCYLWEFFGVSGSPGRRCFLPSCNTIRLNISRNVKNKSYTNAEIGDQVDVLEVSVTLSDCGCLCRVIHFMNRITEKKKEKIIGH